MSTPTEKSDLFGLIKRTGRIYILLVAAIAQLPFLPGALIGAIIIQSNAGLTSDQLIKSEWMFFILLLLGFFIAMAYVFLATQKANAHLGIWAQTGSLKSESGDEGTAWKQVTSLPWRFGMVLAVIVAFLEILPLSIYQTNFLKLSSDQVIYSLIGNLVQSIVVIFLAILLLERYLIPAREILLPGKFEDQLKSYSNSHIFIKLLVIGLLLILISILLIAPIGYHQTYNAIYENIGSLQLFGELRTQLIAASVLTAIAGLGLILLLSRSLTTPIDSLINTFQKVEAGNLSERAKVLGTDEIGELAIYFNRMVSRLEELQQTLEKRVSERTEQLRVSNEVGRIANTMLDPNEVITRVVDLITDSFDYYYAGIFLSDENERWAELKAATGTAGKILLDRRHRLQINKTSMVGTSITTREAQVALDVGDAAIRFNNPLLPNTRSEIAIPLVTGSRVIGALDVQSTREGDFKPEDISTLQSMANQVAIAIENARLFKEMDNALDELRQTNRQYLVSAWADKLKSKTLEYVSGIPSDDANTDSKLIDVNLRLRDESIGHIRLETDREWNKEDQEWVEALATQVAVSLENARLIEESQQMAFRERLSASIIQKLWSTSSVDGILQTAVSELGQAFEASEATITLNAKE